MRVADENRRPVTWPPWPETLKENGSGEAQWEIMLPTPAQTQKALADEPAPNFSRHRHVGLPGLCEDPAE